jgi:hypothetical protein
MESGKLLLDSHIARKILASVQIEKEKRQPADAKPTGE